MATSVTKGGKQKSNLRVAKHTDMTTHWEPLEEQLLMVPLDFLFNYFQEENAFSEMYSKSPQRVKLATSSPDV
jgi:hypothetical protein